MSTNSKQGHRERLKKRFIDNKKEALTDVALLELLLTYAIPQKDVKPLAIELINRFGCLSDILKLNIKELSTVKGLSVHSSTLLKLVDRIRTNFPLDNIISANQSSNIVQCKENQDIQYTVEPTGMFSKSLLEEAIKLLPSFPRNGSSEAIKLFLNNNLPFNSEQTRKRYTSYLFSGIFPNGEADSDLISFSNIFAGRAELREVCFYRFCKAKPLMQEIMENVVLINIGFGQLSRDSIREYLIHRFPTSKSTKECSIAVLDALVAGGLVKIDKTNIKYSYRDIRIPSFAFIIHSEFSEPGMYNINQIENSSIIKAMLWKPDQILTSLYELRNLGLIAKVSEIDSFRQFTTKWTLTELIDHLK